VKKNEELFHLIKSLSKSEKRYFMLFGQRHGRENNYYRLFKVIDEQSSYDEEAIKRHFANEVFIRQLTSTKNYLKQLILKALRNYYEGISKEAEILDALRNIEILYHKGLYQLCNQEIKKVEKVANKYENHIAVVEINAWKKKILQATQPQQIVNLRAVSEEMYNAITKVNEYIRVWQQNIEIPAQGAPFKTHDDDPLLTKVMKNLYNFQLALQDEGIEAALSILRNTVSYFDNKPHRQVEEAETYLVLFNNLIAFLVYNKNHEEALRHIYHLKRLINKLPRMSAPMYKTLLRTYNIELEIYRENKNMESAKKLIQDIESIIHHEKFHVPLSYQLSFWFQFAYIHFTSKEFHKALPWINKLLEFRNDTTRQDLVTFAFWLNLMVHYELNNTFVLRYFVDSTRRYLSKRQSIAHYEKVLLNFFSKIANAPELEAKSLFDNYNQKLHQNGSKIPKEVLDYVDFHAWMDRR